MLSKEDKLKILSGRVTPLQTYNQPFCDTITKYFQIYRDNPYTIDAIFDCLNMIASWPHGFGPDVHISFQEIMNAMKHINQNQEWLKANNLPPYGKGLLSPPDPKDEEIAALRKEIEALKAATAAVPARRQLATPALEYLKCSLGF